LANTLAESHRLARHYHPPHFNRINEIATSIGIGEDGYYHLDLYLWLTTVSGEIDRLRDEYPELANSQVKVSFDLLRALRPKMILFAYVRAGGLFLRLCRDRGIDPNPMNVPDEVHLRKFMVEIDGRAVPVFIPRGGSIPSSRRSLSNHHFQQVCQYLVSEWNELQQM
jgi:hypothetical protein